MRDAHQSLLATRMRTFDMLAVADRYARTHADLFSLEMWGGATFDTAMRFLRESPWDRLARLRERIPNILFQMLVRAASAVGYTNYPDNVVYEFVRLSAEAGMDIFRIFDANNWLPNIKVGVDAVLKTNAICEAAICYTGDILDPKRDKYTLKYFVDLAKQLEKAGAHMLAIKDMAGLLKPYAAKKLVKALREAVGVPIHFHTHDSAGGQIASYMMAAEEGVNIVDCAFAPMAGVTSQPSLNALAEAARFTAATRASISTLSRRRRRTGMECGSSTPPSKPGSFRVPPRCTSTRCPAGSTRTCTNRRNRSGSATGGTRSAGCTPR